MYGEMGRQSETFHLLESKGSKWDASITFKGRLEEGCLGEVGGVGAG